MSDTGKAIMIFGAGINQIELIREAKKLGLLSISIDPQPEPPGKNEADFFYRIEPTDYQGTKNVAMMHDIAGIVTGQTEKSPEIQKIYDAIQNNKPNEWVRVDNLPDLAYFNHSQHVTVGKIDCAQCHGKVQEMEVLEH